MQLNSLVRRDVKTRLGVVPLWSRPEIFAGARPLVLAIQGLFAGEDDLANLPGVVEPVADAALVRLPRPGLPAVGDGSLAAFADAVGELVAELFPARPVLLLGVSLGATAALGVQAASLRRVVAVEPVLHTQELWPLVEPIRQQLRAAPRDRRARDIFWSHLGIGLDKIAARDHSGLLDALSVPADVLLGAEPLQPPRALARLPSLAGHAERAALGARRQVRLHLAPGAGHNLQAQAPKLLKEVLFEACRRAAGEAAYDARGVDEPLVEATPLGARGVLHWGPGGPAFAGAYLSWNPAAQVNVLGEGADAASNAGDGSYDVLALGAEPPPGLLERLAGRLAPGGELVARGTPAAELSAETHARLDRLGLQIDAPVDAAGTGVLRALRAASDAPPRAPIRLEMVACASFLMDVRTRLPARGLRTDPGLVVEYAEPPYTPPFAPVDQPKVLVLQRLTALSFEQARRQLAHAIARGWMLVIEYDDHPQLTAAVAERVYDPAQLAIFRAAHAVQTTTEPLAAFFRTCNPEVRIFENTVFELAPFPAGERPRRVFYGAITRGDFGVAVARALAPVVEAFPDVEFVVLGDRAVFDALPTARKQFEDYLAYEAYLARMAGCAVSLSPIEALPLRETKSDAKFLDAARAGVLTIASPLIYERTITHGVNGLLARGLEDWAPLLAQAFARPDETRAMARRAWDYVRRERMFAPQVAERRDWYRELWGRRAELNALALARIPGLAEAVAAERP